METNADMDKDEIVNKYDSCVRRVEIVRELLMEGLCIGSYLPEDEYKRKETERSLGYFEAAVDVLDVAIVEHKKLQGLAV